MYCPNLDCPHARRTGEPAEYRGGITQCQDCGSTLEEAPPDGETPGYQEFVPVMTVANAALVPVVESLLSSQEIRFFIKGEGLQDLFGSGRLGPGFSIIAGPPVVCVEPDRAEEARELLTGVEDGPREEDGEVPADDDDGETL